MLNGAVNNDKNRQEQNPGEQEHARQNKSVSSHKQKSKGASG